MISAVGGSRSAGSSDQLDRHRGAPGERLDGRGEPAVGQHRRMDAAGQLAQLGGRAGEVVGQPVEERAGRGRVVVEPAAGDADVERHRHEPLLRAVVEVALELAAGLVGGGDDAGARRAQLLRARRLDLAPPQRLLGRAPLGDVEQRAVHPHLAARALDQLAAVEHPADLAVGADDPVLERERLVAALVPALDARRRSSRGRRGGRC